MGVRTRTLAGGPPRGPCIPELFMSLISNRYLAILGFSNSPARAHASLLKTLRLPAVITFSKTKQWTVVSQASTNRYFRTGDALSSRRTRGWIKHMAGTLPWWDRK